MTPDKYQAMALKTFNGGDDPTRHALLGLAGEAGELIELYKKDQYKPEFSWWQCKHCGHNHADGDCGEMVEVIYFGDALMPCRCSHYTPLVLDELGDYSYYLRISAYQAGVTFEDLCVNIKYIDEVAKEGTIEEWLNDLCLHSIKTHYYFLRDGIVNREELEEGAISFFAILAKLDTSLEQVLDLNYRKLNSEPSAHGWLR